MKRSQEKLLSTSQILALLILAVGVALYLLSSPNRKILKLEQQYSNGGFNADLVQKLDRAGMLTYQFKNDKWSLLNPVKEDQIVFGSSTCSSKIAAEFGPSATSYWAHGTRILVRSGNTKLKHYYEYCWASIQGNVAMIQPNHRTWFLTVK